MVFQSKAVVNRILKDSLFIVKFTHRIEHFRRRPNFYDKKVLYFRAHDRKEQNMTHHLTPKQIEVMRCLAQGMPNKMIAYKMGISTSTVKVHLNRIYMRLNITNRLQALLWLNEHNMF